ncbi:MAG: tetratricopeptide repeat protein [Acetobacteraceae bacterium]
MEQSRVADLRAAFGHLQARRFAEAAAAAAPWAGDADGALLHGLALAGSGAVAAAAPVLARIGATHPGRDHPVQDLLALVPAAEGMAHLRAGLRLTPDDPRLLGALGALLGELGPMAEAVEAFERVTRLRPGEPAAWSNLGKALTAEGRFGAAETAFVAGLRLAPGDARLRYNRAVMLLKAGRMAEGWAELAARHALPGRPPALPGRRLTDLDVAGRTVLVAHDEGFGDTLQFIRYASLLADRGARVVAWMPAALARLIRTTPGVDAVATGRMLPRYDVWCPLLDLPGLFGDAVPPGPPYLQAAAGTGLGAGLPPGRKVGLVWAGDPAGLLDRVRSMPDGALEGLRAVPGVTWVSLQKGRPAPGWMLDPMVGAVTDFADTAVIVAQLDLVVSVDTAVLHLAGALGRKVILMDRYDNCWRWLSGRMDSPWYPGLRIVRQERPGDWDGVVSRVAAMLSAGA